MMLNLNMGITLAGTPDFKASIPSTSNLFNVWNKKNYNPITRTVQTSNCN